MKLQCFGCASVGYVMPVDKREDSSRSTSLSPDRSLELELTQMPDRSRGSW